MKESIVSSVVLVMFLISVIVILVISSLKPGQPNVGPIEVTVRDANFYLLPHVRVEFDGEKYIGSFQGDAKSFEGPFYEGNYRVIVKLGEESSDLDYVVYDKVHSLAKGMTRLDIRLDNVIQRFDIQITEQEVKIPVLPYAERKNIVISPYKQKRKNIVISPYKQSGQ